MVSCCRSYIHLEPFSSLKGPNTASALLDTVTFFRSKGVVLMFVRMDNQRSPEFEDTAVRLDLKIELVSSSQKEANRTERAIQTAKHHIMATRAGFHRDFIANCDKRCSNCKIRRFPTPRLANVRHIKMMDLIYSVGTSSSQTSASVALPGSDP